MKLFRYIVLWLSLITAPTVLASSLQESIDAMDADVLFMRHALAPGFGDPANFDINDCSTQRNLDAQGRDQAVSLGKLLKSTKVNFSEVKSSYWCRCYETAELLDVGPVEKFSGLNSFFQQHADRRETLNSLNDYLTSLDSNSDPVLLVTHQVVISAVTGISPASGGFVLFNSKTGAAARWNP
jgi:phosphohistidine phosphatase SixA